MARRLKAYLAVESAMASEFTSSAVAFTFVIVSHAWW
jgi:hypothetical protein